MEGVGAAARGKVGGAVPREVVVGGLGCVAPWPGEGSAMVGGVGAAVWGRWCGGGAGEDSSVAEGEKAR